MSGETGRSLILVGGERGWQTVWTVRPDRDRECHRTALCSSLKPSQTVWPWQHHGPVPLDLDRVIGTNIKPRSAHESELQVPRPPTSQVGRHTGLPTSAPPALSRPPARPSAWW